MHQVSLEPNRDALDSLSNLAELWIAAMTADTTLQDSLNALLIAVFAEGDSLSNLLEQVDSIFYLSVQDSVGALLTWNATLDEDSLYTWYEKRYNEIALNWLVGTEPDSAATADLRQMAQTCLRYGGRAVLGARGLCEVWLREYFGEDNCDGNIQTRNSERPPLAEMKAKQLLHIVPNPADNMVRIYLSNTLKEMQLVQIFNLNGQLVHTANLPLEIGSLSLSVGNWPEGIYVARVLNRNESFSQNFVVQHRH